ncbi:MAG: hypothetical protein KC656_33270, partial [Myxococcales bacterium]|nr:hypothetical protein [Myxococcales bacterium]
FAGKVRIQLGVAEPAASLSLRRTGGMLVPGAVEVDGPRVTFEPADFLLPNTSYTARLDWSCAPYEWTFTTSDIGTPTVDPLVGRAWSLDLGAASWVQPFGVGPLIAQQITSDLLVGVSANNGTTLDILATPDDGGGQDLCLETFSTNADFTNDPFFLYAQPQITTALGGTPITVYDVELSGAFSADGTTIEGGSLTALIDTRDLVPLVDPNGLPNSVCQLVAVFGIACQACPTGGTFCLEAVVEDIPGIEVTPGLVARTSAAIVADPTCTGDGGWSCGVTPGGPAGTLAPFGLLALGLAARRSR